MFRRKGIFSSVMCVHLYVRSKCSGWMSKTTSETRLHLTPACPVSRSLSFRPLFLQASFAP